MKRSLRCTLAIGAVINLSAGCSDVDPVSSARSTFPAAPVTAQPPGTSQPPATAQPSRPTGDQSGIYFLQVGDTTPSKLTGGAGPVWSRDGDRIAFYSSRDGDYDLYVLNRDGSGLTQLTNDGVSNSPNWSPDGSRIAFISGGSLKVANRDGTNHITLVQSSPEYSSVGMGAWSPDGQRFAFAGPVDGKIHVANADGSGQLALEYSGAAPVGVPEALAWSPDGKRIAFAGRFVCSLGSCMTIEVMSAQGGAVTRLASGDAEDDTYPIWSPDGSSIAFMSYLGGLRFDSWGDQLNPEELHVMNADGTGRRRLANGLIYSSMWSADGRTLLVGASDPSIGFGLLAIPTSGGATKLLSSWLGALSPDGRWIAFTGPQ